MADEPVAKQDEIAVRRYIRTHAATISVSVQVLDQNLNLIRYEPYEVEVADPRLTSAQRDYLIETVRRIVRFGGGI